MELNDFSAAENIARVRLRLIVAHTIAPAPTWCKVSSYSASPNRMPLRLTIKEPAVLWQEISPVAPELN